MNNNFIKNQVCQSTMAVSAELKNQDETAVKEQELMLFEQKVKVLEYMARNNKKYYPHNEDDFYKTLVVFTGKLVGEWKVELEEGWSEKFKDLHFYFKGSDLVFTYINENGVRLSDIYPNDYIAGVINNKQINDKLNEIYNSIYLDSDDHNNELEAIYQMIDAMNDGGYNVEDICQTMCDDFGFSEGLVEICARDYYDFYVKCKDNGEWFADYDSELDYFEEIITKYGCNTKVICRALEATLRETCIEKDELEAFIKESYGYSLDDLEEFRREPVCGIESVFVSNNEYFEHFYNLVKDDEISDKIYATLKRDSRYKHLSIDTYNFDSSWKYWDLVCDAIGELYFRLNGFEQTYCVALKDIVVYSTFLGKEVVDLYQLSIIYYSLYSKAYNQVI